MKRSRVCDNCGKKATVSVQDGYPFPEMGIPVILSGIEVVECTHCGESTPIIPCVNALMRVLAAAVVRSGHGKLRGEEIRFLRKYVGKSAVDFSRLLNIDHTHLSKIENNHTEIGDSLDRFVRLLVTAMSPELNPQTQELIEEFPNMDDSYISELLPREISVPEMACAA
ncbi:MAG: hypothetical protein FWD64_12455 [Acidobacteriaceae bacterium]|nr:hypothetical protein [Acidobacteriaceae bacterium]